MKLPWWLYRGLFCSVKDRDRNVLSKGLDTKVSECTPSSCLTLAWAVAAGPRRLLYGGFELL